MRFHFRGSRSLHRTGLVTLLAAAALALSGCWGKVFVTDTSKTVVMSESHSAQTIYVTTAQCGVYRAYCALSAVRRSCETFPLPGMTWPECFEATEPDVADEMERAIQEVIGPDECLTFFIQLSTDNVDWFGRDAGQPGCPS